MSPTEALARAIWEVRAGGSIDNTHTPEVVAALAALGYEVQPILPECPACDDSWTSHVVGMYPHITHEQAAEAAVVGTGHDIPPTAYPDDFPIEQAAEAVDREAAASYARIPPSAAVAPWYCPECGGVVLHDKPAAAPLDVEALREQVYYLLFIYGQMDAEHGHWAAVRRMLNIDAAYDDAIRKRGGA